MHSSCSTIASVKKNTLITDSARLRDFTVTIKLLNQNNGAALVQNTFSQMQQEIGEYQIERVRWSNILGSTTEIQVKFFAVPENKINMIFSKLSEMPVVVGVIINKD